MSRKPATEQQERRRPVEQRRKSVDLRGVKTLFITSGQQGEPVDLRRRVVQIVLPPTHTLGAIFAYRRKHGCTLGAAWRALGAQGYRMVPMRGVQ